MLLICLTPSCYVLIKFILIDYWKVFKIWEMSRIATLCLYNFHKRPSHTTLGMMLRPLAQAGNASGAEGNPRGFLDGLYPLSLCWWHRGEAVATQTTVNSLSSCHMSGPSGLRSCRLCAASKAPHCSQLSVSTAPAVPVLMSNSCTDASGTTEKEEERALYLSSENRRSNLY